MLQPQERTTGILVIQVLLIVQAIFDLIGGLSYMANRNDLTTQLQTGMTSTELAGAGSVVTANVPQFVLVYGVPARQFGWMCRCGAQLTVERGASYCGACGRGYREDGEGLSEA